MQNLLLQKPLNYYYYLPPPPKFSALPTALLLPILNIHMTRRKNRKIAVEISWFHRYKLVVTMQARWKVLKYGVAIIQKRLFDGTGLAKIQGNNCLLPPMPQCSAGPAMNNRVFDQRAEFLISFLYSVCIIYLYIKISFKGKITKTGPINYHINEAKFQKYSQLKSGQRTSYIRPPFKFQ